MGLEGLRPCRGQVVSIGFLSVFATSSPKTRTVEDNVAFILVRYGLKDSPRLWLWFPCILMLSYRIPQLDL